MEAVAERARGMPKWQPTRARLSQPTGIRRVRK